MKGFTDISPFSIGRERSVEKPKLLKVGQTGKQNIPALTVPGVALGLQDVNVVKFDRGGFRFDKKLRLSTETKCVVGSAGSFASFYPHFAQVVWDAGYVIYVPSECFEKRIDEVIACLGFRIACRTVGVRVRIELANEIIKITS